MDAIILFLCALLGLTSAQVVNLFGGLAIGLLGCGGAVAMHMGEESRRRDQQLAFGASMNRANAEREEKQKLLGC